MKKFKILVTLISLLIMMCILSGCGDVRSAITMSESGSGVVSYRIAINKNGVEDTDFTHSATIEELAATIQSKIDPETNIKVTTDKLSSETQDYIIISQEYSTLEEYDKNIDIVIQKYNMLVVEEDFEGLFGYNVAATKTNGKYEKKALKEYLEANGIEVDIDDRNLRKFVKIMQPCMQVEECYEEEKLWNPNEKLKYDMVTNAQIISENGETKLRIHSLALNYLEMYMRRVLQKYSIDIFNTEIVRDHTEAINGRETIEILKKTFGTIDLAAQIKCSLDKKFENNVEQYSMKDFSPALAAVLFDEEFSKIFTDEYNFHYSQYQNLKKEDNSSASLNLIDELYKNRNTEYEITFGGNTIVIDKNKLYELMDDNSCIEVSNKGDINSNEKEVKKQEHNGDIDESPFTGDNKLLVGLIIIALCSLICMCVISFRAKKN